MGGAYLVYKYYNDGEADTWKVDKEIQFYESLEKTEQEKKKYVAQNKAFIGPAYSTQYETATLDIPKASSWAANLLYFPTFLN